jgi:hypothetical protein
MSFYRSVQHLIQFVPLKTICKGVEAGALLKTTLLHQSQLVQHKETAPTHILYLSFKSTPWTQLWSIWCMFNGGEILKETFISLHMHLAMWQSKKWCWMDSSRLHPQHVKMPFHCFFAKLSFVRALFLVRYHIFLTVVWVSKSGGLA